MPENKLCLWSIRMEKGLGAEKLEAMRQKSIFSVTIRKTNWNKYSSLSVESSFPIVLN